jgi:hypothetical protein
VADETWSFESFVTLHANLEFFQQGAVRFKPTFKQGGHTLSTVCDCLFIQHTVELLSILLKGPNGVKCGKWFTIHYEFRKLKGPEKIL